MVPGVYVPGVCQRPRTPAKRAAMWGTLFVGCEKTQFQGSLKKKRHPCRKLNCHASHLLSFGIGWHQKRRETCKATGSTWATSLGPDQGMRLHHNNKFGKTCLGKRLNPPGAVGTVQRSNVLIRKGPTRGACAFALVCIRANKLLCECDTVISSFAAV